MGTIRSFSASNLPDLLKQIKAISDLWAPGASDPEELWFRGDNRTYPLLPSIYRNPSANWTYDEENLHERFRVKGTPFQPRHVLNDWDWYFLGQHHALPTRLLDWTENALVAAYFAISPTIDFRDRTLYDKVRELPLQSPVYDEMSPVIWVLDAGSLNSFSCSEDCVLTLGGPHCDAYLIKGLRNQTDKNRYPIAVLPAHTNERLAVQQSVFTIHGHERSSLDSIVISPDCNVRLAKIEIDRANVAHFWSDLELLGVSKSWLFPGLDSVAETIKWISQGSP
jgi:FRG domain